MRKTLSSVGGELIGYYGLIGQEYEVMMITKVDSLGDYMSLVAKAMLGGAVKNIKTVHLYTGEDVEHAATKAFLNCSIESFINLDATIAEPKLWCTATPQTCLCLFGVGCIA